MQTLGLTGGIGSGKSTAARMFAECGAFVVDADLEAKRLMVEDIAVREALIEAFGAETFTPEGALDRKALAAKVFGDDAAVARLNAIVHPAVKAAFPNLVRQAEAEGAPLLVYEAALLLEAGLDERFDAVAVVEAPEAVRVERVVKRDGVPAEAVEARLRHQLSDADRRRYADFVLHNDGSVETLREQVSRVFDALVRS
jgi:dephospho-CoA kinase